MLKDVSEPGTPMFYKQTVQMVYQYQSLWGTLSSPAAAELLADTRPSGRHATTPQSKVNNYSSEKSRMQLRDNRHSDTHKFWRPKNQEEAGRTNYSNSSGQLPRAQIYLNTYA